MAVFVISNFMSFVVGCFVASVFFLLFIHEMMDNDERD